MRASTAERQLQRLTERWRALAARKLFAALRRAAAAPANRDATIAEGHALRRIDPAHFPGQPCGHYTGLRIHGC